MITTKLIVPTVRAEHVLLRKSVEIRPAQFSYKQLSCINALFMSYCSI